jgi:uncharacterized membrane protein
MAMDATMAPAESMPARNIGSEDLHWALAQGWNDFKAKRGDLILLPVVYAVAGIVAAVFAFNARLFPLIFPLATGFALVGPVAAAGFYELARRREAGLESSWWHFLDPMKGRSRVPIAMLTLMLAGIFLVWMLTARRIYDATVGTLGHVTLADFLLDLFGTSQGLMMIIIGNAVGALFAVFTLAVSAFSFPMVIDKNIDPAAAVITSFNVFRANPGTMIMWGIRVAAILFVAALPLFVGLMVALPVLGYATWHLYTRAVER